MESCKYCSTDENSIDYHEIIECITCALDAKDPYTAGHSQRVSDMTLRVCQIMGFKDHDIERIHIAAHLHDIGKIGVPDAVLNKVEPLTDEEWQLIRRHPQIGAEILSKSAHLNELKDIVLCHHERYDGKGYVQGLKGEKIPLNARIIGIADAFDAMTANRVYRKKLDMEFVLNEIKKGRGTQFDPMLVDIMLDLIEDGTIDVQKIYAP